jgi:glycosyltransferase involved in cell wall biosynthesis
MSIIQDPDRPTVATICGLRQRGCEISAVAPQKPKVRDALSRADVRILDFEIRKRLDFDGIRRLRHELKSGSYDILHAYGNRGLQNGIIALRGSATRLVAYRGRVGNLSFFDPFCWARHLNPRIDRIVCVSDAVRDYFLQMRPAVFRAQADRFIRIYKGHDIDWYRETPLDLTQFGIPREAFVVASVANYRPHKGIDHLVDALAFLPREWPVHLLLIGKMDDARLDRVVNALSDPERVHRIGYREDAPSLAAGSDVFVLPSIIPEGLPRSVIEAMAYRRACIVTDLGGSAELVVDGTSGLHVPPANPAAIANAIARLYKDPDLRTRLGSNARQRIATDFNIEQTIDATMRLYASLVDPATE